MVLVSTRKPPPKSSSCGFPICLGATVPAFERDAASEFLTLAEALEVLGRVHGWPVLAQDQVDNGRTYVAAVRLPLDPAQLPTPFA